MAFLDVMLEFFKFFADYPSLILLLSGLCAGSWFFIRIFQGKRAEDEGIRWTEVLATILGVIVGIFATAAGFIGWAGSAGGQYSLSTIIILLIVGIGLMLRPVNDLPWAAIVGLIAGLIVISMLSSQMVLIDFFGALGFNPYWIMLIIFILVLLLCYMAFKLIEDIGKLMGKILGWGPLQLVVMFFCLFEALLLIFPPAGTYSIAALFGV